MGHCMCFRQVSICSRQMTTRGVHRCKRPFSVCRIFSFCIFRKRWMIMLLPWGSVLYSITVHIPGYSAASTGETKRPQPKKGASNCLSPPLPVNSSWELAHGKCQADRDYRGRGGWGLRCATLGLPIYLHMDVISLLLHLHMHTCKLKLHTATYQLHTDWNSPHLGTYGKSIKKIIYEPQIVSLNLHILKENIGHIFVILAFLTIMMTLY